MTVQDELDSFEWNTSTWRNAVHHECIECQFDTFGDDDTARARMLKHCRAKNHGRVVFGALTREQWIEHELSQPNLAQGHRVAMAQLCWNTAEASAEAVDAMVRECDILRKLGNIGSIISVDNGSEDGTLERVVTTLQKYPANLNIQVDLHRETENRGISKGRNKMIDYALKHDAEYVLLIDGDIEPVPVSVYSMMRYLDCHKEAGCIGAYSANYTKERDKTTKALLDIPEIRVKHDIDVAWTQYGLFRMEMFKQGIRFDEDGPFGEPGWGFEDDDLCYQMLEKGWTNPYFGGMRYLHRNIRSSWVHIEKQGYDVKAMFNKRKEFLVNKWRKRGYNSGKLNIVNAQQLPQGVF